MPTRSAYHSPLRQSQLTATRERILGACAEVVSLGNDLTFAEVAAVAGVQERTVYRHFPNKDLLELALFQHVAVTGPLAETSSLQARTKAEVVAAMRAAFDAYDTLAPVVRAMLRSENGSAVLSALERAKQPDLLASVDDAAPKLPATVRRRVAAVAQVLSSASTWETLTGSLALEPSEAKDAAELAIGSLFEALRPGPPGAPRN